MRKILSHKVVLLISDDLVGGRWTEQGVGAAAGITDIYTALQTGVNMWVVSRGKTNTSTEYLEIPMNARYQYFFGTEMMVFTGWQGFADPSTGDRVRMEDFNGTLSLNESLWPTLSVDTARLHASYNWGTSPTSYKAWRPDLATLPEVGWQVRTFDTDLMYLYRSSFGDNEHFLGQLFTFSGHPVAHRLNRGLFRTAHWLFSPQVLDQSTALPVTFKLLDWLYDGRYVFSGEGSAASMDMTDVKNPASIPVLHDKYWNAWWNANGDRDEFYRLLSE